VGVAGRREEDAARLAERLRPSRRERSHHLSRIPGPTQFLFLLILSRNSFLFLSRNSFLRKSGKLFSEISNEILIFLIKVLESLANPKWCWGDDRIGGSGVPAEGDAELDRGSLVALHGGPGETLVQQNSIFIHFYAFFIPF